MDDSRMIALVDRNDRFKVLAYRADGMIWCGLCADRPPATTCLLCDVEMCSSCESMHFHPETK